MPERKSLIADHKPNSAAGANELRRIREEAPVDTYENMYDDEGAYDLPYDKSFYWPMFQETLSQVRQSAAKSVLEVGCGSGSFAQYLMNESETTYRGFDFSHKGVEKARKRNGRNDIFQVANALDSASYTEGFDTIVCTEVLEHIEKDLDVIGHWPSGVNCVCSVPNFDFATHVRYFLREEEVLARYGNLIEIDRIVRVARPLLLGRTISEYLRQLRWSRDNPKRFLALLGFNTFDNLAGWFVFSGKRK